jgi:hypothetical protein
VAGAGGAAIVLVVAFVLVAAFVLFVAVIVVIAVVVIVMPVRGAGRGAAGAAAVVTARCRGAVLVARLVLVSAVMTAAFSLVAVAA